MKVFSSVIVRSETTKQSHKEVKFFNNYIPLDPCLKTLSGEQIVSRLRAFNLGEAFIDRILGAIDSLYITEWLRAVDSDDLVTAKTWLLGALGLVLQGARPSFPGKYVRRIEEKISKVQDISFFEFRRLPFLEKHKYMLWAKKQCPDIEDRVFLEIIAVGLWKKDIRSTIPDAR